MLEEDLLHTTCKHSYARPLTYKEAVKDGTAVKEVIRHSKVKRFHRSQAFGNEVSIGRLRAQTFCKPVRW